MFLIVIVCVFAAMPVTIIVLLVTGSIGRWRLGVVTRTSGRRVRSVLRLVLMPILLGGL